MFSRHVTVFQGVARTTRRDKAHQQTGTANEEIDYYRDDDDVAVLFTLAGGTEAWRLGNIEEVSVASGTVNHQQFQNKLCKGYKLSVDNTGARRAIPQPPNDQQGVSEEILNHCVSNGLFHNIYIIF